MMRKIFTLLFGLTFTLLVSAQNGVYFDPEIEIDFTNVLEVQVPASPIKMQVLFIGEETKVQVLNAAGEPDGEVTSKGGNDFIGITPDGDSYYISVNHEETMSSEELGDGGGMTVFKVKRGDMDTLIVEEITLDDGRVGKFFNVDFVNAVGETWTNCGGIINADGRIWTAEEYPSGGNSSISEFITDTSDFVIGMGSVSDTMKFINDAEQLFEGEVLQKHENQGWMVEIDPKTGKAIRKQYNWGRMSFEGGAILEDSIVFLTEDGRPGILTKFVADKKGDFTSGNLYVYDENGTGENGNWIKMDNDDFTEMKNLADSAYAHHATLFIRLEWAVEVDGKIFFTETGYDNVASKSSWTGAIEKGGIVAKHHEMRRTAQTTSFTDKNNGYYDYYGRVLVYDPATDSVTVHLEGGPVFANEASDSISSDQGNYPTIHLSNPDGIGKITTHGKNYLLICEDLNGETYNRLPAKYLETNMCELYMLDASIAAPKHEDLMRIAVGPKGAELTGANGTNDGNSILVNIQHPSSSNAAPYNHAVTVALTGWNNINDVKNAMIDVDWDKDTVLQYAQSFDTYVITDTVMFDNSNEQVFEGQLVEKHQNQGWMVEIDPKTAKAVRKQYNWGRMSFEGGAILEDSIVFLSEDGRPGIFTKFVADEKGNFTSGKLFAYDENGSGANGNWIEMDNANFTEMLNLADSAYARHATLFIRLEWVTEIGGKIYFAETGYDNVASKSSWTGAINKGGLVAKHHDVRRQAQSTSFTDKTNGYYDYYGRILVYDPATDSVTVFLEGGPDYNTEESEAVASYPANHLSNPDGLGKATLKGQDYLVINEDLNGHTYNRLPAEAQGTNLCEMYLCDLSDDTPTVGELIRIMVGPAGAELTGGNGLDGNTILVNTQHPWDENKAPFDKPSTLALTGFANLTNIADAHITNDFTKYDTIQVHDDLLLQVLFQGEVDQVTVVDADGDPDGKVVSKGSNDFIGVTADGDDWWLSINHEETLKDSKIGDGGGMTSFKIERDDNSDSLYVIETTLADGRVGKFHNVDFVNTVGETWTNCGGIISPDGRIWTAEEYPVSELEDVKNFITNMAPIVVGKGQTTWKQGMVQQVLFQGGVDEVTVVDGAGAPAGKAVAKEGNDFIGITADGDDYWISINHEETTKNEKIGDGGGMTSFKITKNNDSLKVVSTTLADGRSGMFHNVDFVNTVGETWTNCGGIINVDGRIWTAEEYPSSRIEYVEGFLSNPAPVIIGEGLLVTEGLSNASGDQHFYGQKIQRFENQGWMVEIDPKTGKALRKQYNWGRMSFEGGAILEDSIVFLAEDGRPGILTKFVADEKGNFNSGKLYVYNEKAQGEHGNWILMDNGNLDEMLNLANHAYAKNATLFIRLEWVVEIGGKIYIAETGYDNVASKSSWTGAIGKGGVVATHHENRRADQSTSFTDAANGYYDYYGRVLEYDPTTDSVTVYLEGGPDYATEESQAVADYPANHLSNPDGLGKITVNGKNYMLICEDLNGHTYNRLPAEAQGDNACELYMLDMDVNDPTVEDLTRIMVGPKDAELTGANGTPDGKTILVNVQHPDKDNTYPFNHPVTIALTGWDVDNTSIEDEFFEGNQFGFQLYPNPADRQLYFNDIYDVALYNDLGQLIKVKRNTNTLNISELPAGIYFVKNGEGEVIKLLVK